MKNAVLISGPTSGIGFEMAKIFSENGFNLILVGRNKEKLEKISKELENEKCKCEIIVADLSDPKSSKKIFEQTKDHEVEILVNNAGFGLYGEFLETDLEKEIEMIQVNIVALTTLTKLFLPQMIQRKRGKILNLASTAAFQAGPLMAVYYATKAYVLHFSEAISEELIGSGVSITALCPGPTESGFQREANMDSSMEVLQKRNLMDAKSVARIGYNALMKNKVIEVAGFRNKLTSELVRIMPRAMTRKIVKLIQRKRK